MPVSGLMLALQAGAAPAPPAASVIDIPRIEATAAVDGALDEPVWADAAVIDGFMQYEPVDGRPAAQRTTVRVWYAPDAIWFGIVAHDADPGSIRATRADRGYVDTWPEVRRANASFLARGGTLAGLHDLRRGIVLEAQPVLTVAAPGARTERGFERADPDPELGVNLHAGLSNYTSARAPRPASR